MKYVQIVCFFLLLYGGSSFAQKPKFYWSFEGSDPLTDIIGDKIFGAKKNTCPSDIRKGLAGSAMFLASNNCIKITDVINALGKTKKLTVEFLARGKEFSFLTYPAAQFRLIMAYDYIQFISTHSKGGKTVTDNFMVRLRGSGITSYNFLNDGNWHHYVFRIDGESGKKEIWIDGQTAAILSHSIDKFDFLVPGGGDGFKSVSGLDEFAIYNDWLSDNFIKQHNAEAQAGKSYSFVFDKSLAGKVASQVKSAGQAIGAVDPREFAPGYPAYTVQAVDQLKYFPAPRYSRELSLPRNFPWLDISYLHRQLPGNGGMGFGAENPVKAVEMVSEMANRWNYYAELRCLRKDSASSNKAYSNRTTLEGALINFANQNPDIPVATVTMQVQGNPSHAGYDQTKPYVLSQSLSDNYYLRNKNGKPIVYGNKKWLSPLAPLDYIQKDGNTAAFYLRQMAKYLKRPVNMINDNGEAFGHMRPETLLNQDPDVSKLMKKMRLSNAAFNGWFQYRLDSCFREQIFSNLGWKGTGFTIYNVSAVNSNYWPDYSQRRNTNSLFNGTRRSTPAFYPSFPWNWQLANGANNGYGVIAEGRLKEIKMGDRFFAPFICAGWGLEEDNIRPAQWLGLLKSMTMLGADFFHVGYFNVTGRTGWPNGKGPNDPRGYVYQVAMPSYAQAIVSHYFRFFKEGTLLNPAQEKSTRGWEYRFQSLKTNHLIMVRKLGEEFLIFGAVESNSNLAGNTVQEEEAKITLENKSVRFNIRKQGSMYILNLKKANAPVFYQLDGWHQYEHPWYWSKNITVEAENADRSEAILGTEGQRESTYDFRSFLTFASLSSGKSITFNIAAQPAEKYECVITVRNAKQQEARLQIETPDGKFVVSSKGGNWQNIPIKNKGVNATTQFNATGEGRIVITVLSGSVDLDKISLTPRLNNRY